MSQIRAGRNCLMNDLELKVLGYFLLKPQELNKYEVSPTWFSYGLPKQLVNKLNEFGGSFSDFTQLVTSIQQDDPQTAITEDWLQDIKFEAVYLEDVGSALKTLQKEEYKRRANQASLNYAENQTEQNFDALQDRLRELDNLDLPEDNGELNEAREELFYRLDHKTEQGVSTFPKVDKILGGGLRGGTLLTIGARPAVGKSAFAINMALQAMQKDPSIYIDMFTLEMNKKQMLDRFASNLAEVNSYRLREPSLDLDDGQKERVRMHTNWLVDNTNLRIRDVEFHIEQIERVIRRRQYEAEGKKYIAFVDYLGLIDLNEKNISRTEQIGIMTRTFKILTNELDIPIVLFSQLNRGVEMRDSKKPNLADLRESGNIEQDSSVVAFLYNDEDEQGKVWLDLAKNREGRTGAIPFDFFKPNVKFEEYQT